MLQSDVRWRQRLQNYRKVHAQLAEFMAPTYREEKAEEAESLIKNRYYPILSALVQELAGK